MPRASLLGPWGWSAPAGALALLLSGACGLPPGPPAGAEPVPVVDAHIHTDFTGGPEPASGIPETREQLLEDLAGAGVVAAVAHTGAEGEGYADLREQGIVHCAGVGAEVDLLRVREGLRSGKYRCIKVYLGYVHRHAADPAYEPVYRMAEEHAVPVVFHTGDTYSPRAKLKFAHPLSVDEVAVDHPGVDFVLAHAGYPWIRSAAEVAYKNPNVFLEGSAFLLGDAAAEPPAWVERFVVEPLSWIFGYVEDPSILMFGSDWPLVRIAPYVEAYKRAIPRQHWRAVLHDNAVRVFRLAPRT